MRMIWIAAVALASLVGSAVAGEDHGYLGVSIAAVRNVSNNQNGVFVAHVYPGTGAAAAGIKKRDRIATINGSRVDTMEDLDAALGSTRPGDEIDVRVVRGRREK